MKQRFNKTGFTLIEMAVVFVIITILASLTMPAARALFAAFQNSAGTGNVISAAMAGARAVAARDQRYAGIRFQRDSAGDQYIIFIVHNPEKTGLGMGFVATEGQNPIKLPKGSAVTDLRVRTNHTDADNSTDSPLTAAFLDNTNPQNLAADGNNIYYTDMSCFSIIFSPNANLVINDVRVRNKEGIYLPDNTINGRISKDDIFNSPQNIKYAGVGKFIQDDYAPLGLGAEPSRNQFVIYDTRIFNKLTPQEKLNYLNSLKPIYINPYSGTMVSKK